MALLRLRFSASPGACTARHADAHPDTPGKLGFCISKCGNSRQPGIVRSWHWFPGSPGQLSQALALMVPPCRAPAAVIRARVVSL